MTRSLAAPCAVLSLALLLSACTSDSSGPTPFRDRKVPVGAIRLVAFDSCADLLTGLRSAAKAAVGPYGFGGGYRDFGGRPDAAKAAGDAAAPNTAQEADQNSYSGTNTHEAGVDEPDLVKTDGKRIVTVAGGVLRVVDAASRTATGSLRLIDGGRDQKAAGGMSQLLLAGDHALLLGYRYNNGNDDDRPNGTLLTLVDLTGQPRILGEYAMDGNLVDARQVGSTARIVVRSWPRIQFPRPQYGGAEAPRIETNQRTIDTTPLEAWLPRYEVLDGEGKRRTGRVECGAVSRPSEYSGTAMLTVLSFDLKGTAMGNGDPVAVVADGDTVYANGPSLYVANDQRWRVMWNPTTIRKNIQPKTQVYKFDISATAKPRFTGAGEVDGWLLNQYSMSEWDGKLRVATTLGQPWDRSGSTASTVYVLDHHDGDLKEIGRVGGLGKGERIYAVRFVGTTAYVVTFRQTDPLYTLDLRDPKAPKVVGELKITGYSAYLHPAGDGRLIGVGQEANTQGRTQGTQVSLFDVHDLTKPTRLAQFHMQSAHSEAEFDPHAFLYWAPTGLLVVPMYSYKAQPPSFGSLVLSVHDTSITQVGMITHSRSSAPLMIRRSLVINQTLWTVSDAGLKANDVGTLADVAWVPFS